MRVAFVHNLKEGGARRTMAEHMTRLNATVAEFTLQTGAPVREDAMIVPLRRRAPQWPKTARPPMRYWDHAELLRGWRRVARLVDAFSPDVIVAHPCRFLQCPPAIIWARAPAVYFCHETRRVDHDPSATGSRNPATRGIYAPLYAWERQLDLEGVQSAATLITNSRFTARTIAEAYGRTATAVRMGVPDRFRTANAAPAPRHVLCVGSLIASKGHDLAIRAVAESGATWPVVVVAARADAQEQERLQRIAGDSGVDLTVKVAISDDELRELYRGAVCTMYLAAAEPLGLVALEAQACGCPVIVSSEGGLPETLVDGRTGWVVERDARAAAAKLVLLDNPNVRISVGAAAAEHGRHFSWVESTRDLEAAIARVAPGDAVPRVRPGRLAIISSSGEDAGAEKYIRHISAAARDHGWHVAVGFPELPATARLREDIQKLGAEPFGLEVGRQHGLGKGPVLAAIARDAWRTARWLRRVRADTTLVVLPHPEMIMGALLGAAVRGGPSLSSAQLVPPEWRITTQRRRFYALVTRLGNRWLALAEDNRRRLAAGLGCSESSISMIYNGVQPLPRASSDRRTAARDSIRAELGLPAEAKIALTVGRLNPQKGHDRILGSVPEVLATRSDVWWVWAGDGPDRVELEREATVRGFKDRLRFLGRRDDVPSLLLGSDVFVFPTRYESSVFAVLEAHLAELPVVVSDAGPLPELVRDGIDGLLVPAGEPARLAAATCWVLSHPGDAARMARSGRDRTVAEFSLERMTSATLSLLWPGESRSTRVRRQPC
jgi:glycosyltransferase involved in cell wall biosynthesis